jgi:hypothetical protein
MKRVFVIFACILATAAYGSSERKIPDVRVRVVDPNGAPFQWVFIGQVGYYKLPMSVWPKGAWSEEDRRFVCTLNRNGFFKTDDGWITVKGTEACPISEYRVTIVAPAAEQLEFKDKEWEALAKCAGAGCTLTAHYVHDGHILAYFGAYYSYNACQYYIAADEKYLRCWPELAAAKEDSHITGRSAPYYKGYYFGLLYEYLRFIADKLEPIPPAPPQPWRMSDFYSKDGYSIQWWGLGSVSGDAYNSVPVTSGPIAEVLRKWYRKHGYAVPSTDHPPLEGVTVIPGYPPGYVPLTDEQRQELWDHIKAFVCQDLQEKKAQWGGMVIPWDLWSQPSFQKLHCEGFDLEPKPADAPAPPAMAAPSVQVKPPSPAPSAATQPQPAPVQAPQKH